ncbi:hypothetical protein HY382_00765 [Candidatus Curtissbacteria bacterium]|nr:hypothetical protein [Candidatus Curtissbacteria bacterium]
MAFYLTVVLIFTQTVGENVRYQLVTFLAASTLFLSVFALWGELSGIKYLLLLILPIYFVTGSSLFYFLLPVRWLTRLPFALAFGISVYLLMLTANIFNVAAIRTIALLRAAHAVGLLFSLVATFFLLNVLFSLHLPFYIVVLGSILITTPLYLIELWSYELEDFISRRVGLYTGIFTVITAQFALVLSFWPVVPINGALIISTVMYVLLGLAQFAFADKLKRRQVYEHLGVALIVFIAVILTTKWGG